MIDTPRTDAVAETLSNSVLSTPTDKWFRFMDLARELERENARLRADVESLRNQVNDLAMLVRRLARWSDVCGGAIHKQAVDYLERNGLAGEITK